MYPRTIFFRCKLNIVFNLKIPPGLWFASLAKLIKFHSSSHILLAPVGEGCTALFIKCKINSAFYRDSKPRHAFNPEGTWMTDIEAAAKGKCLQVGAVCLSVSPWVVWTGYDQSTRLFLKGFSSVSIAAFFDSLHVCPPRPDFLSENSGWENQCVVAGKHMREGRKVWRLEMHSPHRDQRISSAQLMEDCAFLVCWRLVPGPKLKPGFSQTSKQHTPHKLLLK